MTDDQDRQMNLLSDQFGVTRRISVDGETIYRRDFDPESRVKTVSFREGITFRSLYDNDAQLKQKIDPLGGSIFTGFGDDRILRAVTDTNGQTTRYDYDAFGSRISAENPAGSSANIEIDEEGRLVKFSDLEGQEFTYAYNAEGQLAEKTLPGGATEEFGYDENGRLVSATNASGTTSLTFLESGLVDRVTFANGLWIDYDYDTHGRLVRTFDADGHAIGYRYSADGWIESVVDEDDNVLVEYEVDSHRRLTREIRQNGTETLYTYDERGIVVSIAHQDGSENDLGSVQYEVDSLGRRTRIVTPESDLELEYDAYSQLTGFSDGTESHSYHYDPAGNRQKVIGPDGTDNYTVNRLDQYEKAGSRVLEYDGNKNLVKMVDENDTWEYHYDPLGRLVRIEGPAVDVRYEYDALGYRIAEISGGSRTELLSNPLMNSSLFAVHEVSGTTRYAYAPYGFVMTEGTFRRTALPAL